MVTGADVRVRVRSSVVTVQVEQTVVLVLVVVATDVQDNTRGVVVAIVGLLPVHKHRTTGAVAPFSSSIRRTGKP